MANAQKGEVALDLPDGTRYTLVLNVNALASIETHCARVEGREVTWDEFMARILRKRSVDAVRTLIWGMARKHHREMTIEQAGDVLEMVGGVAAVLTIIEAARQASTPDPADVKAAGLDRPPEAQAGTAGEDSTSPLAVPV